MPDPAETPLILDTHSWIWLLDGEGSLVSTAFVSEAESASVDGRLYICSISIAEVALLASSGRVRFVVPVAHWLQEALETPGLQVIDIDIGMAAEAAALPGEFSGDTADRMIVAATRLSGGRLATADPVIRRYGEEGHVSVLALEQSPGG